MVGGLLVLFDLDRVLLSKLLTYPPGFGPDAKVALVNSTEDAIQDGYSGKPPLFYGAIGCAVLGIFLVCIGTLGCWSSCLKSHCALTSVSKMDKPFKITNKHTAQKFLAQSKYY